MGNYCCKCKPFGATPVQRKIILLLVGLDNSGKTTAAKGLSGEIIDHAIPTIGFSSVKMKHKGFDVIIYDLGGGPQIRGIWSCYFGDVYGVIFVVDASDESRLEEAKQLLYSLLSHEKLARKPLLVLANKQDVPNALDEIDIVELLRLEPLVNQQKCLTLVEVCSALSPENNEKIDSRLIRGYRWLVRQVINNYEELSRRVEQDTKEAQAALLVQRQEWKKRQSMEKNQRRKPSTFADSGILREDPHRILWSHVALRMPGSAQPANKESEEMANGRMKSPVKTYGVLHDSPTRFSSRIKQQVDMADGRRWKKSNKVFPRNEMNTEAESMTVRALTSPKHRPTHEDSRQCQAHPQPMRPYTSKSLGTNEIKPWGLDEELRLVEFETALKTNMRNVANDLSPIEYFHTAA